MNKNFPILPDKADLAAIIAGREIELRYLRRLQDVLEKEETRPPAPDTAVAIEFDLSKHDPAWKDGVRLTEIGYEAIVYAFDHDFGADQVAELFKIGLNNAYAYRRRWLGELEWPYHRSPRNWRDPRKTD